MFKRFVCGCMLLCPLFFVVVGGSPTPASEEKWSQEEIDRAVNECLLFTKRKETGWSKSDCEEWVRGNNFKEWMDYCRLEVEEGFIELLLDDHEGEWSNETEIGLYLEQCSDSPLVHPLLQRWTMEDESLDY